MKIYLSLILFIVYFQVYSQHNWTRTNPGGGGAIAMVGATADGTIVTASDLSGVYISSNNGDSWKVIGATQGLIQTHISSLGFHATEGNIFIMGTAIGAFKTKNGGDTVYPVQIELGDNGLGYIESIGMAISDASIGYMAHYEDWLPILSFLKTTDAGETWQIVNTTGIPTDARIVKILVDQNNTEIVYALTGKARFGCTDPNLYRSTNGGSTWIRIGKINGVFPQILDFDLHPTNSSIIYMTTFQMASNGCDSEMFLYASDTGGFYKSTNQGTSFQKISDQNGIDHSGIISVGTNPQNISLTEIINTDPNDSNSGTWKTTNGGTTWQHTGIMENWKIECAHPDYAFVGSFNGLVKTFTKDRFKPDRLYGSFGQWSWSTIDGGNHINNISCKEITTDHYLSTGMENIEGNWIDVNDSNSDIVYAGYYDLGFWYTKNHGASWKKNFPDVATYPEYSWWAGGGSNCNFVLSDPVRENVVWASFSAEQPNTTSALFKSTEYGENWNLSNNGLKPLSLTMHGMSIDNNSDVNNRTMYLTQEGEVYKSTDDGENWIKKSKDMVGVKFTEVDKKNSQLVYAGGENGFWRSVDGGENWNEVGLPEMHFSTTVPNAIMRPDIVPTFDDLEVTPPTQPTVAWQGVFDIKADPNIENRVYVIVYGTNKGLYRSDNAGSSWTKLYTNDKMRGVAIAKQNSNIIYTSSSLSYHSGGFDNTSLGILVSYDTGTTWEFANDGMAWTNGGRLDIESGATPHIWAWSPGTGIQHALIPNFTLGIDTENTVDLQVTIYPNPTSGKLYINTRKIEDTTVAIVYSITGKRLKKISLSNQSITELDITNLSSGLYILKISGNRISKTIKFLKE